MQGVILRGLFGFLLALGWFLHAERLEANSRSPLEQSLSRLADNLREDDPALQAAAAEARQGKASEASKLLAKWFQQNRPPEEFLGSLPVWDEGTRNRANDVLDGRFTFQEITGTPPVQRSKGIDWHHQGPRDDKEWAWFLNRHRYLLDLLVAWKETADPAYLERLHDLLRDWLESEPWPRRLTFSASWRALETARRILEVWPSLFYQLEEIAAISPEAFPAEWEETRVLFLVSLLDHGENLRHYPSFWGGNHLLTEKAALATHSLAWPIFKESEAWLRWSVESVEREILTQVYPDGAYRELTNHYQRVVLENTQRLARQLAAAEKPLPPALRERLEAMWSYFALVRKPDGFGPLNSASDAEHNAAFLNAPARYFQRPDWLGRQSGQDEVLSSGLRLISPPPPDQFQIAETSSLIAHHYPWAGHLVARSSWAADADWLFFDYGPHGTAHQHADRFHLSTVINGRDFLIDTGRYIYQPGPWREFFSGAQSHNVLLLNGQPTEVPPLTSKRAGDFLHDLQVLPSGEIILSAKPSRFASEEMASRHGFPSRDSRHGLHSGASRHAFRASASHARAIVYSGEGWLLIADGILAYGQNLLETRWQFAPEMEVATTDGSIHEVTGNHARGETEATGELEMSADIGADFGAGNQLEFRSVDPPYARLTSLSDAVWDTELLRGATTPVIGGWQSGNYNDRRPATTAILQTKVQRPTLFLWLVRSESLSGMTVRWSPSEANSSPGRQTVALSDGNRTWRFGFHLRADGQIDVAVQGDALGSQTQSE